jgi:cytochrome c oxidase subunit 2
VYAGYQLFQPGGIGGCSGCHTVSGTPSNAQVGPNLTHLQARAGFAGFILPLNDANLRLWLRNPQAVKPGANMVLPTKLTEDQITSLIAYLDTLK